MSGTGALRLTMATTTEAMRSCAAELTKPERPCTFLTEMTKIAKQVAERKPQAMPHDRPWAWKSTPLMQTMPSVTRTMPATRGTVKASPKTKRDKIMTKIGPA